MKNVVGQISGIVDEGGASEFLGSASNVLAGGAMGFAAGGPWGAAAGVLTQSMLEVAKHFQNLTQIIKANVEAYSAFKQKRTEIQTSEALEGIDVSNVASVSAMRKSLEYSQRAALSRRDLASSMLDYVNETTVDPKKKAQELKEWSQEYDEASRAYDSAKSSLEKLTQKEQAYSDQLASYSLQSQANIRAYRQEQRRHDLHYEAEMQAHYAQSAANRQAYRSAMASYRQGIASRDMWIADQQTSMEQESLVAGISGYWRTGNMSDYLDKAKQARQRMKQLVSEISTTGDLSKVAELQQQYQQQSTAFSNAMTVANLLKPEGNPLQRIALENLTSLAGRGGWMGEKYNTDRTFEKLNEMATSLRNIDDNTREQFKAVYD